ncbi:MAG: hypothetical protein PHH75_00590 [Candidatus Omnitrophica bacterium]|nr:hypothetical protein [Candidatus Omnitrophota bacterium]MDD5573663.1 hypothetical protein [Candidatus Omnitrophota bacterium]
MMKKAVFLFVVFSFAAGICGMTCVVAAQEEGDAAVREISGAVSFVDPQGGKLIIVSADDEGEKEAVVAVDSSSTIEKDGKAAGLTDVSIGDDAAVSYKTDHNGRNVVVSLSATTQQ